MKHLSYTSLIMLAFCACCLLSCTSESAVFLGEWQDAREPGNVWSITKQGSKFLGKRVSGSDFHKYESEEWIFEIGEAGFPTLVPVSEKGSTLTYQVKENRILRNPPGRLYVKKAKDSKK